MSIARFLRRAAAGFAIGLAACGGGGGGGGGGGDGGEVALAIHEATTTGTFTSLPFSTASITLGQGSFSLLPGTILFETSHIAVGDAGRTIDVTAADDPDFAALVAVLTDGVDDWIGINVDQTGMGGGSMVSRHESGMFPLVAGAVDPDLAGYTVTRIRMFVDTFSVNAGTGDYTIRVSFAFFGRSP